MSRGACQAQAVPRTFSISSVLEAPRADVWAHASSPAGINDEMFPLARMTFPKAVTALTPETVPVGTRIGRSWVLLFGVLPVDYDDVTLVRLDEGRGFLERSTMLTQRVWQHERCLEDEPGGGCRITDVIEFEPRLPGIGALQRPIFRLFFANRHRRLRRRFGAR